MRYNEYHYTTLIIIMIMPDNCYVLYDSMFIICAVYVGNAYLIGNCLQLLLLC